MVYLDIFVRKLYKCRKENRGTLKIYFGTKSREYGNMREAQIRNPGTFWIKVLKVIWGYISERLRKAFEEPFGIFSETFHCEKAIACLITLLSIMEMIKEGAKRIHKAGF